MCKLALSLAPLFVNRSQSADMSPRPPSVLRDGAHRFLLSHWHCYCETAFNPQV